MELWLVAFVFAGIPTDEPAIITDEEKDELLASANEHIATCTNEPCLSVVITADRIEILKYGSGYILERVVTVTG